MIIHAVQCLDKATEKGNQFLVLLDLLVCHCA